MRKLVPTVLLFGVCTASLLYCKKRPADPVVSEVQAAGGGTSIIDYGNYCAEHLEPLPAFDCLSGTEVPITVTHGSHTTKATSIVNECDRPPYLAAGPGINGVRRQCKPFSRAGTIPMKNSNIVTAFVCRHYNQVANANYPYFNDVAVIQHDTESGKTCFFQMVRPNYAEIYGGRVPPPNEEQLPPGVDARAVSARNFWLSPKQIADVGCVSCHDSDPFIHTPYIDQVAGIPSAPKPDKYIILGAQFGMNRWPTSYKVVPKDGDTTCTKCHDIGSIQTCESFAPDAVGASIYMASHKTDAARTDYKFTHWMPNRNRPADLAAWKARHDRGAQKILNCCRAGLGTALNTQPPIARYGLTVSDDVRARVEAAGCDLIQNTFVQ